MHHKHILHLPSPRPVTMSAKPQICLRLHQASQHIARIHYRYLIRTCVWNWYYVMVYCHYLDSVFVSLQSMFKPQVLPITHFTIVSIWSGRAEHYYDCFANFCYLREREEFFEKQITCRAVMVVSAHIYYLFWFQ